MSSFEVIASRNDIKLNSKWVDATKNSNHVVDENGKIPSSDYSGRRYLLINMKRAFSGAEKFGRGLLGFLAVVTSLGLSLIAKSVRDLFAVKKINKIYGIPQAESTKDIGNLGQDILIKESLEPKNQQATKPQEILVESKQKSEEITDLKFELEDYSCGKHKRVYKINNSDLVLKVPKTNLPKFYSIELKAYVISQNLGLNVVPFVALVNANEISDEAVFKRYPGLNNITDQFPDQFMILQTYIPIHIGLKNSPQINVQRAHEVLFFNLITGRSDSKSENSMQDEQGNVWEIDNDFLGWGLLGEKSLNGHWLKDITDVWKAPISTPIVNQILNLHAEDIGRNIKDDQYFLGKSLKQMENNLVSLQAAIRELHESGSEISFENLMHFLPTLEREDVF